MSIRQFEGRIFFNNRAINLKVGGRVSDDGQQTVIAMDESTHDIRIIRCDLDALNFPQLARMVNDHFGETETPTMKSAAQVAQQ